MSKKNVISANYLDYIPKHSDNIEFTIDQDGSVTKNEEESVQD